MVCESFFIFMRRVRAGRVSSLKASFLVGGYRTLCGFAMVSEHADPRPVQRTVCSYFVRPMRHTQVAEAMLQAAASVNVQGETFITTPTDGGAYVVSAEPKFSEGAIRYPGDV